MREITINNEIAYECINHKNYFVTKTGSLYSIYVKGAHGKTDINKPHKVAYGTDKDGYYRVVLSMNSKKTYIKVHTLVAEQFIGDIIPPNVVNHKDGNKQNNNIDNLEIVSIKENTIHAWQTGLCNNDQHPEAVSVIARDNVDNKEYQFGSMAELERITNLPWRYIREVRDQKIKFGNCYFKKITTGEKRSDYYIECYFNGELFKIFDSVSDVGKYFGHPKNSVSGAYASKYRSKLNRYTLFFPNVSTTESITTVRSE